MVFMVFANLHLMRLFSDDSWSIWWSSLLRLSPRNSSYVKGTPTNQPEIRTDFSWIEFCQKSWNYFHEHDLRRAFRLPCLQKRLKKILQRTIKRLNRPTVRWCIAWLKMHKMHLKCKNATFLCETCFKTELGAKRMLWNRKGKTRNKQFEFWSAKTLPGLPLLF